LSGELCDRGQHDGFRPSYCSSAGAGAGAGACGAAGSPIGSLTVAASGITQHLVRLFRAGAGTAVEGQADGTEGLDDLQPAYLSTQPLTDLPVGHSVGDQRERVALPCGQRRQPLIVRLPFAQRGSSRSVTAGSSRD